MLELGENQMLTSGWQESRGDWMLPERIKLGRFEIKNALSDGEKLETEPHTEQILRWIYNHPDIDELEELLMSNAKDKSATDAVVAIHKVAEYFCPPPPDKPHSLRPYKNETAAWQPEIHKPFPEFTYPLADLWSHAQVVTSGKRDFLVLTTKLSDLASLPPQASDLMSQLSRDIKTALKTFIAYQSNGMQEDVEFKVVIPAYPNSTEASYFGPVTGKSDQLYHRRLTAQLKNEGIERKQLKNLNINNQPADQWFNQAHYKLLEKATRSSFKKYGFHGWTGLGDEWLIDNILGSLDRVDKLRPPSGSVGWFGNYLGHNGSRPPESICKIMRKKPDHKLQSNNGKPIDPLTPATIPPDYANLLSHVVLPFTGAVVQEPTPDWRANTIQLIGHSFGGITAIESIPILVDMINAYYPDINTRPCFQVQALSPATFGSSIFLQRLKSSLLIAAGNIAHKVGISRTLGLQDIQRIISKMTAHSLDPIKGNDAERVMAIHARVASNSINAKAVHDSEIGLKLMPQLTTEQLKRINILKIPLLIIIDEHERITNRQWLDTFHNQGLNALILTYQDEHHFVQLTDGYAKFTEIYDQLSARLPAEKLALLLDSFRFVLDVGHSGAKRADRLNNVEIRKNSQNNSAYKKRINELLKPLWGKFITEDETVISAAEKLLLHILPYADFAGGYEPSRNWLTAGSQETGATLCPEDIVYLNKLFPEFTEFIKPKVITRASVLS